MITLRANLAKCSVACPAELAAHHIDLFVLAGHRFNQRRARSKMPRLSAARGREVELAYCLRGASSTTWLGASRPSLQVAQTGIALDPQSVQARLGQKPSAPKRDVLGMRRCPFQICGR